METDSKLIHESERYYDNSNLHYPGHKQSLNFESVGFQEKQINQIINSFEAPLNKLGIDDNLHKDMSSTISELKSIFTHFFSILKKTKTSSLDENKEINDLIKDFYASWTKFENILHQIAQHSAYFYFSREIERLILDITGAIKSIRGNPPAFPELQKEFSNIVENIQDSFVTIADRFANICDSKLSEAQKIDEFETLKEPIQQFYSDIIGERSKFFHLSSASHSTQEKAKKCINISLIRIIESISELPKETHLIENINDELKAGLESIEKILGFHSSTANKNEDDTDILNNLNINVRGRRNSLKKNCSVPTSEKIENTGNINLTALPHKGRNARRCTINSMPIGETTSPRRKSRRRQSIKRNSLLIDLSKSDDDDEDGSFCSSLSEFQDVKDLLYGTEPVRADISGIDENDDMYQLSDFGEEDYLCDENFDLKMTEKMNDIIPHLSNNNIFNSPKKDSNQEKSENVETVQNGDSLHKKYPDIMHDNKIELLISDSSNVDDMMLNEDESSSEFHTERNPLSFSFSQHELDQYIKASPTLQCSLPVVNQSIKITKSYKTNPFLILFIWSLLLNMYLFLFY